MSVHHFLVGSGELDGAETDGELVVGGAVAKHARARRVVAGELVTLADGTGLIVEAEVRSSDDRLVATVRDRHHRERAAPDIVLVQAVVGGDRMDDVVRKGAEVGVARIVPFLSERGELRWSAERRTRAVERWRRVVRSGAEDARSPWLTDVADVADGPTAQADVVTALDVSGEHRLRDVLPAQAPATVALVVGPAGGLSEQELDALASDGAAVASLGDRVLRSETAGVVAAAIVAARYGRLG